MSDSTLPDYVLDTAIIGAGVAGLYTAWRLVTEGGVPADQVMVFEGSDRICGRLMSASPPHIPNIRAELGGMRYMNHHKKVVALIKKFDIETYPFPVRAEDLSNIAYLRGEFARIKDFSDPVKVPYKLGPNEKGKSPGQLIVDAIAQMLPGVLKMNDAERREAVREKMFDGIPLYKHGFWQLLCRVLSGEAYSLAVDGGGYDSTLTSWNAADAIPWFLSDFGDDAEYFGVRDGYDALPRRLAAEFENAGGRILRNQRLKSFDATTENGDLQVAMHFENTSEPVLARRTVLAMPRRSLELLDQTGALLNPSNERVHRLIRSVTPHPMFKLFCAYEYPWWKAAGVSVGKADTDLPVRQCYYFGTVDEVPDWNGGRNLHSLAMASYDDGNNVGFWDSLRPKRGAGRRMGFKATAAADPDFWYEGYQPQKIAARESDGSEWNRRKAPRRMVQEVQRQLAEIHGLPYIPEPYSAAFMDWGDDPYGGGWNSWNIGVESWNTGPAVIKPMDDVPVFICGEAYSDQQGWVEGALDTAEQMLTQHFAINASSWLL